MSDIAISVKNVSKMYKLYDNPMDRLKESLGLSKKKRYKEHFALNNVSFSINKGEIVGFVGKNGAGKSTVLKIITGLLTPSEGNVQVGGTISALLELGTGFNPEYSGAENIYLYGTMMGKSREEIDRSVPDVIKFADIGDFINQPVKTYSSGMFARLAFSVAVNVKPDILIVDEILAVGDLDFQLKCMNKMKEMMLGGTTVLFVTHDINAIKRFCTRAIWLRNGELIEDGDVNKVTNHYLDFLKVDEKQIDSNEQIIDTLQSDQSVENAECDTENDDKNDRNAKNDSVESVIAEIKSFKILNVKQQEIYEIDRDTPVSIEIIYEVNKLKVEKPVIGVAIRRIDEEYICGLNTLLDEVDVPWKLGENRIVLQYKVGTLLMGGQYFFDVAIYDETATVPIQYIRRVKDFEILGDYKAEGIYIIPHEWKARE